jgi:hypothetical protein
MSRIFVGALWACVMCGAIAGCWRERDPVYVDHRHDHDRDFDRHDEHERHDDDRR